MYDGMVVGEYVIDLMIEQALLVELKTTKPAFRHVHVP
jgi:hypothetical protein